MSRPVIALRVFLGTACGALVLAFLSACQSQSHFIPALDNEPIKPGDILLVHCDGIPTAESAPIRWVVDDDGYLKLPYARPWRAAGKRPAELAAEMSKYFSVRRTVTFTIEKLGAGLSGSSNTQGLIAGNQ